MAFYPSPYSSGNPTIDALFAREFGNAQAQSQAEQAAAAQETARQQVMAQAQLARAQQQGNLQQQQFANQLAAQQIRDRELESAERSRQGNRQLDILEKDVANRAALGRVPTEAERRKQTIIDANANAKIAADRFQSIYDTELERQLDTFSNPNWYSFKSKAVKRQELEDPNHPDRQKAEQTAWQTAINAIKTDRTGAGNLVTPDIKTRRILPARFDEQGNVIPPVMDLNPTDPSQQYDWQGNPNPAALGTSLTPPSTVTPTRASTPTVTRPFGSGQIQLSAADDALLMSSVAGAAPEQRQAVAAGLVSDWLKSGRARTVAPQAPNPFGRQMLQGLGGWNF